MEGYMDDSALWYVVVILICVVLSGFFSATETAFSALNRIRLKNLANSKNKRDKLVVKLSDNFDNLISTILIGNNIVNILAATLATYLFTQIFKNNATLGGTVSTIVMTVVVLIFGEISPKTLAKKSPEFFARAFSPIILMFFYLFYPLTKLFGLWQALLVKLFKSKDKSNITDEELITYIDEAENEGGIDEYEGELIRSAIEFDDLTVEDILTPRVDVDAIEISVSLSDVIKLFRETGYSRFPVYKESIDTIVGIVNEKDCYRAYFDKVENWEKLIAKDVIYVPPTTKISVLLRKLQKAKNHMAIVVDEFGGTMGIATMEDILEELVGEIWDEHDEIIEQFVRLSDDKATVIGDADLEDFFDYFEVNQDETEYDSKTVSGFIIGLIGSLPNVGDSIEFENLVLTVKAIDCHKITKIDVLIKNFDMSSQEQN